ncbi:MAG: hypothetical protein IJA34_00225 [Lachnospiraceae bacterium]|nr:hypothetical protein [Lachnospiraceae bacterium]
MSTETNVVETNIEEANNEEKTDKKPEWQEKVEELMKNAYTKGLSVGGKAFVGSVYRIILEDKKNRINPAKTLIKVENTCKKLLAISPDVNNENKAKEEQSNE